MKIHAITERTDQEWPDDHPLRKISSVIADDRIDRAEFLICSYAGEDRLPAASDDHDEPCSCTQCKADLIRRASGPSLPPICRKCWDAIH